MAAIYLIAALISGLIYPIFGHWAWAGLQTGEVNGWLAQLGFVDFAGSTVVHSVGGWTALAVLLIIGARSGRFPKDGPPQKIHGANIPLAALGVLLLYVGWIGFNGGSTLAMDAQVTGVVVNTILAGSIGMITAMIAGFVLQWQSRSRLHHERLPGRIGSRDRQRPGHHRRTGSPHRHCRRHHHDPGHPTARTLFTLMMPSARFRCTWRPASGARLPWACLPTWRFWELA